MAWFVVNVADAQWERLDEAGQWARFETDEDRFPHFGINIHVVQPGQPNAKYHRENTQEDFLILHGECVLIIEGEERRLKQWDFVHCPPGTAHVFVGAGDGPCAILMVGARHIDDACVYPKSDLADNYGAGAAETTSVGKEAYAGWGDAYPVDDARWPL